MGFTMVQLLPCAEFSDPAKWGYNPRQLMALHRSYGTPQVLAGGVLFVFFGGGGGVFVGRGAQVGGRRSGLGGWMPWGSVGGGTRSWR
jgi:hypothetical protein